jgi:uncharacterized RDD family membrane protein YckC
MPWYYAEGALQNGPVTDEEFADLVRNGRVQAQTLVWREGMANWQPYSTVALPQPAGAAPAVPAPLVPAQLAPNEVLCHECGKAVSKENAIQYGTVWVCANCKPLFLQKLREGAMRPVAQAQYAGFWIRFVAKFIDGLILGVILILPFLVILFQIARGGRQPDPGQTFLLQIGFQVVYLAFQVAFNTFFIGKFGATPGKMACSLRVVMSDGRTLSFGRAFGRACADILSNIICSIGYIIAAFDDQKRALHDHICDTRVVRK